MVNCCWCNRTGSCRNCACVKAGKPCQSCLPSRLGHCLNASNNDGTPPTLTPTTTPHSPPHTYITYSTNMPRLARDLDLPSFTPTAIPAFMWGSHNSESFRQALEETYMEIRHWRPNLSLQKRKKIGVKLLPQCLLHL